MLGPMRRLVVSELGNPPVVDVVDEADPAPGPGQVVVEVAACGIGYVDALMASGEYQIKVPAPFTPAGEVAGRVVAVGDGVGEAGPVVGQRVAGYLGLGGLSTHLVAQAGALVAAPEALDDDLVASLPASYWTAFFALTERTRVDEGQTVLVLGAGGGVGLAAVDVARSRGATVVAAASSPEKRSAAEAAGAAQSIDYEAEDLTARLRDLPGGGVDVIFDPVGGEHSFQAFRALNPGGTHLVVGFTAGDIPSFPLNRILLRNKAVVGVDIGWQMQADPASTPRVLGRVLEEAAEGHLLPPRPHVVGLDGAAEAFAALRERRQAGKVVVRPGA